MNDNKELENVFKIKQSTFDFIRTHCPKDFQLKNIECCCETNEKYEEYGNCIECWQNAVLKEE